ncbi:MAG: alpha/beta hydrolase [Deltaproteobacteria bacterium]|nr:MAG: alpha/beta hydrolase [Deltaproteobacteria bacterium]TMB24001.1 MAG: alpha/beta hydrolase [Deltaproteobacteria bacterium]
MRSRTVDLGGPVHFADFGGSGPTMVLVHGLGGSHLNWLAVGPALAARARVLAPDLAGFGRTPLAGRSAHVRANAQLLDRFIDAVAEGPATLIGNSMGGLLAMMEAERQPEKVTRLVLVGAAQPRPPGTRFDPVVALTFAAYAVPGLGERFMRWRAARRGPEGLVRDTLQLVCADPGRVPAEVVAAHVALARDRMDRMPWGNQAFLEAARSIVFTLARRREVHAMIGRIAAPALLVQGTRDRLVSLAASRATAALRPDWTLAVLEGIGHVPQLEAPERFVATVTGWLDGNVGRAGDGVSRAAR